MAQSSTFFPAAGPEETVWRSFNFTGGLVTPGETLMGAPVVTVTVLNGTDAAPQSRLLSGPAVSGNVVSVLLGTMLSNVVYQLLVTVTTSAGQVLELWATQACNPP